MKKVYCRLAVLMAEKDPQLSQRTLAKETSLSTTTVNKLFTNRFDRLDCNTIQVLCNYFDCL
ncbi:helix-turn-helix domain-containing protein, partial [Acaryochloris marina NIES-2412]|uniref:helix-turn-helix domain-containing protein n=1 Tax=Acaryochloris marina TaxID=155978 RepID=UPI004058E52D